MSEERIRRLKALRDEDIDLSEVPDQGGKSWRRVAVPATGTQSSILLLDADVATLFKENGDATAERMNTVLREYAIAHRKIA